MIMAGRTAGAAPGPGGRQQSNEPYATPNQPTVATRPVYPYPYIARYKGVRDTNDAANYQPVKAPDVVFNSESERLTGPDNQKFYHVEGGKLTADSQ